MAEKKIAGVRTLPCHHGARRLVDHGVGRSHAGEFGHRLRASESGKLGRVPLDELERVSVRQRLEGLDDLRVLELVLPQEARLDVLRVNVFIHISDSGRTNTEENLR